MAIPVGIPIDFFVTNFKTRTYNFVVAIFIVFRDINKLKSDIDKKAFSVSLKRIFIKILIC